jgi:hypothetical protein
MPSSDEGGTPSSTSPAPSTSLAPVSTPSASSGSLRSTRCTSGHLAASLSPGDGGAAGSRLPYIVFTNTGTASCTLQGWPGVSFVGNGDGTQLGAAAELDRSSARATVTLAPGASAHAPLRIVVAENYPAQTCQPTVANGLRIYPPGETHSLFIATAEYTACLDSSVQLMSVQAIQPDS